MARVVDNATGQLIELEDGAAQTGLLSGALALRKGQVAVRSPDGEVGSIPAEQFEAAAKQGFTLSNDAELREAELQAQHGGIGGIARAGAEGAARGLTFGLSDAAARELSPETADEMRERQEAHPIASTVGEVAGAAAPILASGGTGAAAEGLTAGRALRGVGLLPRAVARAGEAAGGLARGVVGGEAKGLLGQVAQRAVPLGVQGGVEGAAYGVGHEVSEAALGDTQLTAEKVLAGARDGALFGAAAGGLIGAGEVGVRRAVDGGLRLAGRESVEDFFRSFASERTIKALGATSRDIQRLGSTPEQMTRRMNEISETVLNYRLKDGEKLFRAGSTTGELAERTAQAADQEGSKIGAIYKRVDKAIERGEAAAPDVERLMARIDDEVIRPLRESEIASVRARADRVERELASLRERVARPVEPAGPAPFEMSAAQRRALEAGDVEGLTARAGLEAPDVGHFAAPAERAAPKPLTVEELVKARQDLQNVVQPKTPAQMGIPAPPPEHAEQLVQARRLLQEEVERTIGSAGGDLSTEYQAAKRLYGDLKDANKFAERWSVRDLGNRAVSPTDYLTGVGSGVAAAAHGLGGVASFGAGLLATAAHNVVRERGSIVLASAADAMANRIAALNAARAAATSVDRAVAKGVKEALAPALARTPVEAAAARTAQQVNGGLLDRYRKSSERVQQLAAQPEMATAKIAAQLAPLEPHAPNLAARVATLQTQKAAFLREKMPAVPPPMGGVMGVQRHLEDRAPPTSAQASYMRTLDAAEHPKEIPQRLAAGKLTPEDAEVLARLYPGLRSQIQQRVLEELAKSGRPLPFQARLQLGMLFDQPIDEALSAAFVADMQAMYATRNSGGQEAQGGQAPRPKAGKIDTSSSMLTTAQRVQMGD